MGAVPRLTDAITALIGRNPEMSVEIVEDTSAARDDLHPAAASGLAQRAL